jgi:leucyl-tRNA synthetase
MATIPYFCLSLWRTHATIVRDTKRRKRHPIETESISLSSITKTAESAMLYKADKIEPRWRERWEADRLYATPDESDKPKWFSLTMYPYPSGILHIGHWYAFAVPDVFARFQRMRGYNVLFPMGFDAFGLPAENAAIRNNIHPAEWTFDNIDQMRAQYRQMGAMIDWSRELITCTPDYYHWNQWIFLQMLERGLAYRQAGAVWWCPKDQTVLANEQVLEGNICERCGSEVVKRDLEQWYFRITHYVEELLSELDNLDWPERVKTMQRNWIGRSEGARLTFAVEGGDPLEVFTTRPDTVWGATFMVLAPEHPLVAQITTEDRRAAVAAYATSARNQSEIERMSTDASKPKTGEFTGAYALNPVTDERIPIWIADYVLMGYGTGAIMAVPAHDERDFAFARAFELPLRVVIQPEGEALDLASMTEAYYGDGRMVNSGLFDGTRVPDGLPGVIAWLEETGRGKAEVNYRLRDWLVSRQRYWGTPIPVVYCDDCGMVPLTVDQLPVELPLDAEFTPTGRSPLVSHASFLNTVCPRCGKPARRETDTFDTFVDSSWYWYRYTSPKNASVPFDPALAERWTPVDLYCGGIEHAILHLLYARFFTKVLRDLGMVDHGEPFVRLRNQGMILAEEGTKMSKSRGTQVSPDELVQQYGADALRLHLMYLGPWDQGGPWNTRGITGMERFIRRVYGLVLETVEFEPDGVADPELARTLERLVNKTIQRVTTDLLDFQFNTMVAALIEFSNSLADMKSPELMATSEWREALRVMVLLMAPSTPYVAEELWETLGGNYSVHTQTWPVFDEGLARDEFVELVIQINGKVRGKVTLLADVSEAAAMEAVRREDKIATILADVQTLREIYVPGRLVNFVVKPR